MRKRILSILLAICMVITLMPQAAFAEGETDSTSSLSAFATKDQLMNSFSSNDFDNKGKLVFGKNSEGKAQEWYILGKDGGVSGDNTMIFAADSIAKSLQFRSDLNVIPYDKSWGCEYSTNSVKEVAANHYGASDLRKSLQNIAKNNNYFSSAEQGMMNATRIENWDYYGDKISVPYYTTDKLYALDSNPFTLGNYVLYNIGSERKALNDEYLWINGKYFWMREIEAMYDGCAYVTYYPHRTMYLYPVNAKYDARPAGNLNLSNVLFASAATATSLSTAKSEIIASGTAMTLRLDGSRKDIGRAVYDITTGDIKAMKGSASGNVALVVQGNDGTRDWYYSQKITGTQTINASTIRSALGLSAAIDLSSCKIWLETTAGDGMIYAVATDGCSNEAELLDAINKGVTTVSLVCDITLSGTLDLSDKNITLDLNGHTLKGDINLADTSAAPESILTMIDSNPARGGRVDGKITLTRDNGSVSHLYANGGTVTGQVSMPSFAGKIYCTSSTPTVFKGYVGNYGEIHGGIFYGDINEGCIKEKTVAFMNDGSRYALEVVASGSKAAAPAEPVKSGSVFVGWYNGDAKYDFTKTVTDNITLTAKWVSEDVSTDVGLKEAVALGSTFIRLTNDIALSDILNLSDKVLTLDLNGNTLTGDIMLADTSASPQSILTLIDSNPAKGGILKGNITLTRGSYGSASHLYANGGTVTGQVSMPSYVGGIYCTSSTPTVFKGYVGNYGGIYGGIFYSNINEGCIKEKTVTFMNGSSRYALEVVADGSKVAEPIVPPVKIGYPSFDGWYDGDTKYTFGSTLSENLTLTAKFGNPITYNITYDLGEGGTATNPETYTVESEAITLINPVKEGYIFTGWSGTGLTVENNMIVTIPKGSTGNRVYMAHYTQRSGYSVVFNTNGGNQINSRTGVKWTDKVLEGIIDPTREGYNFSGWKCGDTSVGADTTYAVLAVNENVSDIILTAQWTEKDDYSVSFNTGGGDAISEKTDVKWTDKVLEGIADPTREGYTFSGWKCGETEVDETTNYSELVENDTVSRIKLTAQWIENIVPAAPTGAIRIDGHSWDSFNSNITFDRFYNAEKEVTIAASGSGTVTIEYLLSDRALDVDELDKAAFTRYDGAFSLDLNHEYVIYARLTDANGYVTYINSGGIVMDTVPPVISGIENGSIYCSPHKFTVTEKYIDSVTIGGAAVMLDKNNQFALTLQDSGNEIVATDKAGNKSEMTVTVRDGHKDADNDHICDYCGTNVSVHEDDDNDHLCDICGVTLAENTGGGGGGYISPVQKPTIEAGEGVKVTLSADGTVATITVDDGYQLTDVVLNGVSKGKVTEVKDLKTGDKLVVTSSKKPAEPTEPTKEEILALLSEQKLAARSKLVTMKNGKKAVRITWYNQNGEMMDFDGVEIFRSTKRNSGYGKKPIFTSVTGKYYNTAVKSGIRYYYKVRGFVIIDGQKYCTDWSLKAIRTVK